MKPRSVAVGRGGVVAATVISYRKDADDYGMIRKIRLDICGADRSVIRDRKSEIAAKLRLLYCVIERLAESRKKFSLGDIVSDYRRAMAGECVFADMVAKAGTRFPLRADLVTVGPEFRGSFEYIYPRKRVNYDSLTDYIDAQVISLRNECKVSRARAYEYTCARLREYTGRDNLSFGIVDKPFIAGFAAWLKDGGIAPSTQSFYLRTLRSILNHAREENLIAVDDNLFRGIDTKVLFDRTTGMESVALNRETIRKIRQLDLCDSMEALVRDMFLFGFYCRGMELVDIAHLTPGNIRSGILVYNRRQAGKEVAVPLEPDAAEIVRRYDSGSGKYIFPFLYDDGRLPFATMRNRVQVAIKKIGTSVGFPALTFSMNIAAYRNILSQCRVSALLD